MAGRHSPLTTGTVEIFDRSSSVLYTVPVKQVIHLPPICAKRAILCAKFDPTIPDGGCPFRACKFAHAVVQEATTQRRIHLNYAYKATSECRYECHAPGTVVAVREPPSSPLTIVDWVASECILKTKAKVGADPKKPAARCAHFYYTRECHLGSRCEFVHVMHLATGDVTPFDRAPAPSTFGRGRDSGDEAAAEYGESQFVLARGDCPPVAAPLLLPRRRNDTPTTEAHPPSAAPATWRGPASHSASRPDTPPAEEAPVPLPDVIRSPGASHFEPTAGPHSRLSASRASFSSPRKLDGDIAARGFSPIQHHRDSRRDSLRGCSPPRHDASFNSAAGAGGFSLAGDGDESPGQLSRSLSSMNVSCARSPLPLPSPLLEAAGPVWWVEEPPEVELPSPSPPSMGRRKSWRHNPYA